MKESNVKIYLLSSTFAIVIFIIGILIYHNYFNEPSIVFNESSNSRNVASHERITNFQNGNNFTFIIEKTSSSVVFIRSILKDDDGTFSYDTGSGVIISPNGQIVTNNHVVENAEKITISTFDNVIYEGELVARDEETDLAIIKINGDNLPFVFFGNSDDLNVGDWVLAIGNPFKLKNSVSAGIVSAKNRTLNLLGTNGIESYIQTDAAANPGNSGGALIDLQGKLIGIMAAITSTNDNFQGYSFAIPSNIVKKVAFDLINYGVVQRGRLGIIIKNTEGNHGIQIERVNNGSAADVAGLKSKDIILRINNYRIINVAQFDGIIAQYKPGDIVEVFYTRNSKSNRINLTLTNSINTTDLIANRNDEILTELGFILRDLTSKEKSISNGVIVVSVIKGSKISKINVEPNYIIQEINGEEINNVDDFIAKYNKAKKHIKLQGIYQNYPGVFPYVFEKN